MEWNNYSYGAHKCDFLYKLFTRRYIFSLKYYERKGVSESIDFDNINFFPLVLRNNHSLNTPNFRCL